MAKRVLVGIGAGLVAASLLVGVATAGFKAGRARDGEAVVVRDGEAVRAVERHWDRGPGFGFVVFPLLVTGLVVLVASRWGTAGPGWAWGPGPEAGFGEWHRRAHEEQGTAATPPARPLPPAVGATGDVAGWATEPEGGPAGAALAPPGWCGEDGAGGRR